MNRNIINAFQDEITKVALGWDSHVLDDKGNVKYTHYETGSKDKPPFEGFVREKSISSGPDARGRYTWKKTKVIKPGTAAYRKARKIAEKYQ